MSILTVEHLSHGFGDRTIFDDVSFRLLRGEHIGLVGANGEGKSTFMGIITGALQPDTGRIEWARDTAAGYLDQHTVLKQGLTIRDALAEAFSPLLEKDRRLNAVYEAMADAGPDEMDALLEEMGRLQTDLEHSDFFTLDVKIEEVARALGIMELGLETDVTALSGGQRSKILLARLLLAKPDILLLDEPTNYLDEEHIDWLRTYLQGYENAFILISHDIDFLNSVVNVIYHVKNTQLERYVGDYEQFQAVYAVRKEQQEAAYKRQQQEIAGLKDFVARNKARVATRNMAMSRQKKLDKMERIELNPEKPRPQFAFRTDRAPSRIVFETEDLVIGYDEPLSRPISLRLERGDRIILRGANGIGKTTLLKSLLGLIPALTGRSISGEYLSIGYFEQETTADRNKTCLQALWDEFPTMTQQEVRAALAHCGLTTKHIESKVAVLSGGEQAKLRLASLMNRPCNLLVLDEPTNHLDQDAKESLQEALLDYQGTILMTCHEPAFYEPIVTGDWDGSDWTLLL